MKKHAALLGIILAALFTVTAVGQSTQPDLTLHGTITDAQANGYVQVAFNVPANIERLTVAFHYTGKQDHATLDLGISDPDRFRGWSGGNKAG